ncbi:MAG: hypothetical protein IRZ05_18880 [Micromonosporaceae bacterium]|nr:hypothetical protein [Micromonosporaceae bacterium]
MLRRYVPLIRRRAIKRTLMARRLRARVPDSVLAALTARSGGVCEMQLVGCQGQATDPCHRIKRGIGGRHGAAKRLSDRLSNLVHGCRMCHDWCHARPAEAYDFGLMLREWQDPAVEPVLRRGQWVLLDDDGGWEVLA